MPETDPVAEHEQDERRHAETDPEHHRHEIRGRAQGLFSALMQFASLVASLAAGFLYEFGHNVPFLVIGGLQSGMVVVALILTLFMRRRRAISPATGSLSKAALE